MKNLLLLLSLALFSTSCMTSKRMAKLCAKCPTKDSVSVVTRDSLVYRDSIVVIPPIIEKDTASIRALIECDSLGNLVIKSLEKKLTEKVNTSLTVKGNQVIFKCLLNSHDSLKIHLRWVERHSIKDTYKKEENTPVVTNELKDWQVVLMVIGALTILGILGFIFFKIAKIVKPV